VRLTKRLDTTMTKGAKRTKLRQTITPELTAERLLEWQRWNAKHGLQSKLKDSGRKP
jgi:hypothetical protein